MPASPSQTPRLVADVGGTNTRIALFDPVVAEFRSLVTYTNREFERLEDIIATWLDSATAAVPEVCCIAVAAPPSADRVVMSNIDWSFSCRELASMFGFRTLLRLNDFEANAYALPHLADSDRKLLYPGKAARLEGWQPSAREPALAALSSTGTAARPAASPANPATWGWRRATRWSWTFSVCYCQGTATSMPNFW